MHGGVQAYDPVFHFHLLYLSLQFVKFPVVLALDFFALVLQESELLVHYHGGFVDFAVHQILRRSVELIVVLFNLVPLLLNSQGHGRSLLNSLM